MPHNEKILGLKDYKIKDIRREGDRVVSSFASRTGPVASKIEETAMHPNFSGFMP